MPKAPLTTLGKDLRTTLPQTLTRVVVPTQLGDSSGPGSTAPLKGWDRPHALHKARLLAEAVASDDLEFRGSHRLKLECDSESDQKHNK